MEDIEALCLKELNVLLYFLQLNAMLLTIAKAVGMDFLNALGEQLHQQHSAIQATR